MDIVSKYTALLGQQKLKEQKRSRVSKNWSSSIYVKYRHRF